MVGEITTASNPVLEVSVSFGRFENDSLSWEKWSAFSPNKYLEEVEKCATPGSVAQKKAYFEAHYKKIAARKAELLEQEKQQAQNGPMRPEDDGNDPNGRDLISITSSKNAQVGVSRDQTSAVEEVKQEPSLSNEMGGDKIIDLKEEVVISEECKSSVVESEEELDRRVASPKLGKAEEDHVLVKEVEAIAIDSQPRKEAPESVKGELGYDSKVKEEKVKLLDQNQSQKVNAVDKERNVAKSKKKPVLQINKTPNSSTSTPKVSRPTSNSSRVSASASQSSAKKSSTPSLQRTKNPPPGETKKVVSKSLHLSLSLGSRNSNPPVNSDAPSLTTPRKSLFMEKMGDKDIVKRAFKAFQNNFKQVKSYGNDGSSLGKQVTSKRPEQKVSSSTTPRKENVGSLRTDRPDKRNLKTPPSSFGLKSNERADKRKEFSKKLEEKSNVVEHEKTRLQSRSKDTKEAEIKKVRQSLNLKAIPMPTIYRGQKTSKSTLDKVPSKNETRR